MIQNNSWEDILTSFDKKFSNPKASLSCRLEWLLISNLKKLENNTRPGGEGEMIAVMKREKDIVDYDPIQMITGAGLVFMGQIVWHKESNSW